MTPITNAERLTWQRQAHLALGRLLERAAKENLPPIPWRVGTTRNLHGECLGKDPASEFAAWEKALGDPGTHRQRREEGCVRLTAVWESLDGCKVVLTATIWDEHAGGKEATHEREARPAGQRLRP
jgi:hypothetical protein